MRKFIKQDPTKCFLNIFRFSPRKENFKTSELSYLKYLNNQNLILAFWEFGLE